MNKINSRKLKYGILIGILAVIIVILIIFIGKIDNPGNTVLINTTEEPKPTVSVITQDPTDIPTAIRTITVTYTPEITATPEITEIPTPVVTPTPLITEAPKPDYIDIDIISAGDLIFHMTQVKGAYNEKTDTYSFEPTFKYVKNIISKADLAVANFETTLHDKNYSGYPGFCSPLSTLDAIKDAGFDFLLYANNHSYDRRSEGLFNTIKAFRQYGFLYAGATDKPDEEKKYKIVNINGINVGILNYTDSITGDEGGKHTLNGNSISDKDYKYINIYTHGKDSETLYSRLENDIKELNDNHADIIIAYMHWGDEYDLKEGSAQRKTAQKLCDLGVDIIIGGHPHVIQPSKIITATDNPERKILCFYSVGNFVSNQNRLTLSSYTNKNYTEDGMMVNLTIRKYSNGLTEIHKVDYTPTWVHRYKNSNGLYSHIIIPLPEALDNPENYGLTKTDFGVKHATESYKQTTKAIDDAVKEYNKYLSDNAYIK